MDDLDFDPFSSKRFDNERPAGPFLIREELPPKILKWKQRIHPDTKKPQLMIGFDWQRVSAERIVLSFESHVRDWTTNCVKKREALDKRDVSDNAHSLFATDPNGKHIPNVIILRNLVILPAQAVPTASQSAIAAAASRLAQTTRVTDWINDATSPLSAEDRLPLLSFCRLTALE